MQHRIFEVDGLKGLAIFAILIYHFVTQFNLQVVPDVSAPALLKSDAWVAKISSSLLFGKIYPVFSLLFGFTFFLQTKRQKEKGTYTTQKAIRRACLLFAFGALNSLFFPDGDILVMYAIMGLLLIPLSRLSTRALAIIAVILFLQPFQLYYIFKTAADPHYVFPPVYSDVLKKEIITTLQEGSLGKILLTNITKGPLASMVWSFESGRLTQMPGMFLCGVIAGRMSVFDTTKYNKKFWLSVLFFSFLLFFIIYTQKHYFITRDSTEAFKNCVSLTFSLWLNLFFSFGLVALFIILFNTTFQKTLFPFTYLGKMSLTNYIVQSIIGSLFFFPFGLNLASKIGVTGSFLLSIPIGLFLIIFSKCWLQKHAHGPLEYIWSKLSAIQNIKLNYTHKN
ncbi:hypothetical protein A8C56_19745 [Niabella ginsenosidivorans]|uniref:DUF418 domain-containing protein n=1 Tax=Niabella ginsenosidivorans TaxID=1176587 RepID=A0A1A9I895_9BACT|nr:DUF418 domain-containing protein [Niabella ginsenosidivorans]ANH82920.1 hypothetical protein A8C56_19745 [Niabella ginsenosidivorans]